MIDAFYRDDTTGTRCISTNPSTMSLNTANQIPGPYRVRKRMPTPGSRSRGRPLGVRRAAVFILALVWLALVWSLPALAAPPAELWPKWLAHHDASTASIDHTAWNR